MIHNYSLVNVRSYYYYINIITASLKYGNSQVIKLFGK